MSRLCGFRIFRDFSRNFRVYSCFFTFVVFGCYSGCLSIFSIFRIFIQFLVFFKVSLAFLCPFSYFPVILRYISRKFALVFTPCFVWFISKSLQLNCFTRKQTVLMPIIMMNNQNNRGNQSLFLYSADIIFINSRGFIEFENFLMIHLWLLRKHLQHITLWASGIAYALIWVFLVWILPFCRHKLLVWSLIPQQLILISGKRTVNVAKSMLLGQRKFFKLNRIF